MGEYSMSPECRVCVAPMTACCITCLSTCQTCQTLPSRATANSPWQLLTSQECPIQRAVIKALQHQEYTHRNRMARMGIAPHTTANVTVHTWVHSNIIIFLYISKTSTFLLGCENDFTQLTELNHWLEQHSEWCVRAADSPLHHIRTDIDKALWQTDVREKCGPPVLVCYTQPVTDRVRERDYDIKGRADRLRLSRNPTQRVTGGVTAMPRL